MASLSDIREAFAPEYAVVRLLGRGGMASVYLARETALGRLVAIKVLDPSLARNPSYVARFEREAATAAQLQHPNIVPVYRVGELRGFAFYTMGYVEGESLAERLRHRGRLTLPESVRLISEIARALHAAHRRGIIHRDVKPHNVLLDRETGRALVTDFGIARAASAEVAPAAGDDTLTGAGVVLGTPRYMSPEQAAGTRDLTPGSDLYALGIILYEALSGEYPYRLSTPPNFQLAHLTQPPIPLVTHIGDMPAAMDETIQRLLAKDASERYASGEEVVSALAPIAEGQSGGRRARRSPGEQGRVAQWVRVALGGALVLWLLTALISGGDAAVRPDPRRSILVGFFENATGEPGLDWLRVGGVEQLGQALGRWEDLEVVHVERLLDLARRENLEDGAALSRDDALRLARAASVGTATLGTVLRIGAHLRLTVRVYDAEGGGLLSTATVEAPSDSLLPQAFGELADRILDLSGAPAVSAFTPPTRSIEAYRAYVEGVDARSRYDLPAAVNAFDRAIRADPHFDLAYYELSQALLPQEFVDNSERFVSLADSALLFSQGRPAKERLLLEAYHAFVHADLPKARALYTQLLGMDSTLVDAWSGLGDASQWDLTFQKDHQGRDSLPASFAVSRRAYERALALDGSDHRLYGSLAKVLATAALGVEGTIAGFHEAPPGDITTVFRRVPGVLYRVVLDADTLALVPSDSLAVRFPGVRLDSMQAQARREASAVVDRWLQVAPDEGVAHLLKARLLQLGGEVDAAMVSLDRAERLQATTPIPVPVLRAMMLMEGRRPVDAVKVLDGLSSTDRAAIPPIFAAVLANTYLVSGRLSEARALFPAYRQATLGLRQSSGTRRALDALSSSLEVGINLALDRPDRAVLGALEQQAERQLQEMTPQERGEFASLVVRQLLLGYAQLGDTAKVAAWRRRIGDANAVRGLDALAAFQAGDSAEAARRYRLASADTSSASMLSRIALARVAEGLHRPDEALAHYAALDQATSITYQLVEPTWLLLARSYPARAALLASRGDVEGAKVWYRKFLDVWQGADAELRPELQRARRDLAALERVGETRR